MREVQRRQLIEGFAAAATAKGYADTTIADVVRHARTSKTTFYEHFADKEAAYSALHDLVGRAVETAIDDTVARTASDPLRDRVEAVVTAYLHTLVEDPVRLAEVRLEAQVATPEATAARSATRARLAGLLGQVAAGQPAPSDVALRLGVAGTAGLIAETVATAEAMGAADVQSVADGVLAVRADLVDAWLRLLSPVAQRVTLATPAPPAAAVGSPEPPPQPVQRPRPAPTFDWRPGM